MVTLSARRLAGFYFQISEKQVSDVLVVPIGGTGRRELHAAESQQHPQTQLEGALVALTPSLVA